MPDQDGDPTEEELKTIREFDLIRKPIKDLLDYVHDLWKWADCGYFNLKGKRVLYLELHTGGWSGNEDLIYALQKNFLFWGMYWQKSYRGGHYYFKIRERKK